MAITSGHDWVDPNQQVVFFLSKDQDLVEVRIEVSLRLEHLIFISHKENKDGCSFDCYLLFSNQIVFNRS